MAEAIRVSPIHDLRGHFNTICLSARVLELEPHLSKPGRLALKRIHGAIEALEGVLERLERGPRSAAPVVPLFQDSATD
jgi:hypothetical protein